MIDSIYDFQELYRINRIIEDTPTDGTPVISYVKSPVKQHDRPVKLGVFPSSFNPLTKAHTALLKKSIKKFRLDEVLLLLDKENVDKKEITGALLEDRLLILNDIYKNDPAISTGLSSHGLFLDKIVAIRRNYGEKATIYFIVGYDTIVRILDEKYYNNRQESLKRLFYNCSFIVANRSDKTTEDIEILFRKKENSSYKNSIFLIKLSPELAKISSTLIREHEKNSQPMETYVPKTVNIFIKETGLYEQIEYDIPTDGSVGSSSYTLRKKLLNFLFIHYNPQIHIVNLKEALASYNKEMSEQNYLSLLKRKKR